MGWRIVQQPNGKLARFSDIVDNFTDYDMTPDEAIKACIEEWDLGQKSAQEKVQRGSEAGIERWNESVAIIRRVHGDAIARDVLTQICGEPVDFR